MSDASVIAEATLDLKGSSLGSADIAQVTQWGALTSSASTGNSPPSFLGASQEVVFDGSTQSLQASGVSGASSETVVLVARYLAIAASGNRWAFGGSTAGRNMGVKGTSPKNFIANAGSTLDSGVLADTTSHVLLFGFDGTGGANGFARVDGTEAVGATGTNARSGTRVGNSGPSSANAANVAIKRVLVIPRLLTQAERASLATYLAASPMGTGAASAAPVNTTAPAVTGSPAVGSTLASDNGAWNNAPTSYAYQWQESTDGGTTFTDVASATAATFTPTLGGRKLRSRVTATNATGFASAFSNVVTVPAAPASTAAPTISPSTGPYAVGQTITGSIGTFSSTVTTTTKRFFRGASPITATTSTGTDQTLDYQLSASDQGATIRFGVVAHGPGGDSTEALSDPISVPATTPISNDSGVWYYSGGSGNTSPAASLGGARGGIVPKQTVGNVFGPIPGSVAQNGGDLYAVLYPRNTHPSGGAASGHLYVKQQLAKAGLTLAVGVPTQAAGTDVPALSSASTPPAGQTFTTASTASAGQAFGDLASLQQRGVIVKLTIAPGTTQVDSDAFVIGLHFDSTT